MLPVDWPYSFGMSVDLRCAVVILFKSTSLVKASLLSNHLLLISKMWSVGFARSLLFGLSPLILAVYLIFDSLVRHMVAPHTSDRFISSARCIMHFAT